MKQSEENAINCLTEAEVLQAIKAKVLQADSLEDAADYCLIGFRLALAKKKLMEKENKETPKT